MDNYLNCQYSEEAWDVVRSVSYPNNPEPVTTTKQRCQANARERDRTQKKGKNAIEARKKLINVYGEDVLTICQRQNWFAKYRSGNFDVKDAPRSGRPVEADKDTIKPLVVCKPANNITLDRVNMAFNALRLLIPTEPPDRKLSKIEILRLAGSYITHLDNQLYTGEMEQPCLQNTNFNCKNTSLCTFCWSAVKKEKPLPSTNRSYETPY